MIKLITTSKLFITSSRQQSIMAAIENPVNAELVQQLSEYLSDESKQDLNLAIKSNQAAEAESQAESEVDTSMDESSEANAPMGGNEPSSVSHPTSSSTPSGGNVFDDFSFADSGDAPAESEVATPTESADVQESTAMAGDPVLGSTEVAKRVVPYLEIMGLLNASSDTCGVIRAESIDDEFWLYYADEVNLNDIMISVIEILNATGYTYLKFNRLGRSNNAIIFDIKIGNEDIQSIKEISET